ncbi:hypothetical protein [Rhodopirellula sp. SWK7]|uniref:hypothetical protein n=1 Tax=Rhodopirellula sp. SWK7 TaxID=595460 RepID=UPI00034BD1F4|nr:hypothetical protein [Rhodopirellula sp. SWK7]
MHYTRCKSGIDPRGHSALFLLSTLLCFFVFGNTSVCLGEVIKVIDGDLNSALQKAATGDTVQCDPSFQIFTGREFVIDKSISLVGLNAKLKDGVGKTEILLVTADNVHLADIQVTGNIGTITEKQRTSLIKFEAEGFVVERVVGKDCLKDVICIQGSKGKSIKGGLVQDVSGTNIGRDVVSIAGRYVLYKTLVSDVTVRRVKCFGSVNRGAVEVSDGTRNITVDDVYAEDSQYGVDIQTHKVGETNENITISNVVVKNCDHAIRMATKANSNKNLVFKNIRGTDWREESIPVQVNNATGVVLQDVEISGSLAGGVVMEVTEGKNVTADSFTHNSKPVGEDQIRFNDYVSDVVLAGKAFRPKRKPRPELTDEMLAAGATAEPDGFRVAFEGEPFFAKVSHVNAPVIPNGSVGAEVGQAAFDATTTGPSVVTVSSNQISVPIDSRASFGVSLLAGLKSPRQGNCRVRVRLLCDNEDSCTTSWLPLGSKTHEAMQKLSWEDLRLREGAASMIKELRIQFAQNAFPQPAQDVYVDELKTTLDP